LEKRRLGKTEYSASILTLGGCGPGMVSQGEANKSVELVMKHGVNMIDVAPSYGNAEVRLRPWVEKYRGHLFLAEKTMKRTKKEALEELHRSLENLGTDHFDLYQFHAVGTIDELKQIFGKGGAMEAFKEAKETGLIRFIGITGHEDVRVHIKALEMFDFDTVLAPINVASMAHPYPVNDFRPLLKMAKERGIGVIAIKSMLRRRWTGEKKYGTWYEPVEDANEAEMALKFALSQEGVTTYSLPCDVKLWPTVLEAAERFRKVDEKEQEEIIEYARKHLFKPLFPE
jgi:aryl-alcohol dehydrogenase-like predicted oxidoreductase